MCRVSVRPHEEEVARLVAGELDRRVLGNLADLPPIRDRGHPQPQLLEHVLAGDDAEALLDPAIGQTMIDTAQNLAQRYGLRREEVDAFARRAREFLEVVVGGLQAPDPKK